jgi:hypothetical protein
MFAKRGSLPAKQSIANGRPDSVFNPKEPSEYIFKEPDNKTMRDKDYISFDNKKFNSFKSQDGTLRSLDRGDIGFFESTGHKMPHQPPYSPRGFDSPTEKFDTLTDELGNIRETRKHDSDEGENLDMRTPLDYKGKEHIRQHDPKWNNYESRNANPPKNKKYDYDANEHAENMRDHKLQVERWNENTGGRCGNCGGTGKGFNWSNSIKASTGRVGRRTGYGKCVVCNGKGKA